MILKELLTRALVFDDPKLFAVFAMPIIWTYAGASGAAADSSVEDLIRNVQAFEVLYDDIEVRVTCEYRFVGASLHVPHGRQIKLDNRSVFFVRQDGMFHLEASGVRGFEKEIVEPRGRVRLFDGEKSRALSGNIANISTGQTADEYIIRPHMLLLQNIGHSVPLSVLLRGGDAIAAYPGEKWSNSRQTNVRVLGDAQMQDEPCRVVVVDFESIRTGTPTVGWKLWLAERKNYLPVRVNSYSYRFSKEQPIAEAYAKDIREIEPGVWFPYKAIKTAYDKRTVQKSQKQVPIWRRTWKVTSVGLHPKYDKSFFSSLDMPKGTFVYELDSSGKIQESRYFGDSALRQGAVDAGSRWRIVLIGLNCGVIGLLLALILWRKYSV